VGELYKLRTPVIKQGFLVGSVEPTVTRTILPSK